MADMTTMPPSPPIDNTSISMHEIETIDITSATVKKGLDGTQFAVYSISITLKTGLQWIIEKRYQEFRYLRREIRRIRPELDMLPFPEKNWFFNLSTSVLKYRSQKLREYLLALLEQRPRPIELSLFLHVSNHVSQTKDRFMSRALLNDYSSTKYGSLCTSLSVKDFHILKVLGRGSFGKVYLVRPLKAPMSEVYAMKVLRKSEVTKRHQVDHTMAERRIMAEMNHPYILSLRYAFQTPQKLYMITDYCSGGELFFHLKRMRRFTEDMVKFYGSQISLAIDHLHSKNIIYRDLKPENVLLDSFGNCKLTDFGLSKINHTSMDATSTFCGTPEYLSPEMLLHRSKRTGYGLEIDWWALGIVSFELLTGWPPFFDRDFNRMCDKILNRSLRFPTKVTFHNDTQSFIKLLLQRDPLRRLGCGIKGFSALKSHPFFCTVDWNAMIEGRTSPPFIPTRGNPDDTRNFDKEFTKLTIQESPTNSNVLEKDSLAFDGFTFVDNSCMSDNEEDGNGDPETEVPNP